MNAADGRSGLPTDIRLELERHEETGLLVATSPDLKGLAVFGRTIEAVLAEVPATVAELIEAQFAAKVSVEVAPGEPNRSGFAPLGRKRAYVQPLAA